jgi:indole-3-glycerol phosphate synthase
MSILQTIVERKKVEVLERKGLVKESLLIDQEHFNKKCVSLSSNLRSPNQTGIIAEFKRRSPSKPSINLSADAETVASGYDRAGVSGISILTDIDFFGGSDHDLKKVRLATKLPILRKDFIIDPYQIIEAKSLGADVILLIAEILTKHQIDELSKLATEIGLEVLMEVHTADQLLKYNDRIANIGVNNRNLKTFTTDIQYSTSIYPQLPQQAAKVSESGLDKPEVVVQLKKIGYNGFLIGENFMKTNDPGEACCDFIKQVNEIYAG